MGEAVRSFRDLHVWQRAMELLVESYRVAATLPHLERYGLVGQIQRAAISVVANIAEGHGRDHLGEYLNQLSVANGSLMELHAHFEIVERLGYAQATHLLIARSHADMVGKMLAALVRSLKRRALQVRRTSPTPNT